MGFLLARRRCSPGFPSPPLLLTAFPPAAVLLACSHRGFPHLVPRSSTAFQTQQWVEARFAPNSSIVYRRHPMGNDTGEHNPDALYRLLPSRPPSVLPVLLSAYVLLGFGAVWALVSVVLVLFVMYVTCFS